MKKFMFLLCAVILVACSSAPTAAPTEPPAPTVVETSPTAVVIVQTVVVEATQPPTVVPSPTAEPPTAVPASPTPVVVTVVVEATQAVQAAAPTTAPVDTNATNGLITMDQALGAGWFTDMTLTKNALSLRCQVNKEITFSVKPLDPNITEVDFYYRIVDQATGSAFDWQNAGKMIRNANDSFSMVFTGDKVNVNYRKPNAWLDFQFIGVSRSGGVVARSEKVEQQVTYTLDCP